MTQQITIPLATLEQLVGALEMPCDRWSVVQFKIANDAIKAGRAALAQTKQALENFEPLTDAEIIAIAVDTMSAEPGRDGYILPITFARAILAKAGAA